MGQPSGCAGLQSRSELWHNQAILNEAEFTLNGSLGELGLLTSETERFCRKNSLAEAVEFDLNLVLEELFTNAVRHGGCAGLSGAARIRLGLLEDGVAVEFRDRGTAFNPADAPAPDLAAPLAERAAGGMGIHLVKQIMQDLAYERTDGWNRIRGKLTNHD